MKPRANEVPRAQKSQSVQGEGPNWILIAGGALLSALSIRLGYKLKQALDVRQQENASNGLKGLILCIALANCLLRCAYSWKWYLVLKLHTTPLSHRGGSNASEVYARVRVVLFASVHKILNPAPDYESCLLIR